MKIIYRKKMFDIHGISDNDSIFKHIIKKRCFYEADLLEYIYSVIKYLGKSDLLVIDVGANMGNHSLFLKSFVASKILSVEPNPEILPILERNLKNNIDNYTIIACALGEKEGNGSMVISEQAKNNSGMAKVDVHGEGNQIRIIPLDDLVAQHRNTEKKSNTISLIKIDVEEMEMDVVKGAIQTLSYDKPELFIEASTDERFHDLKQFLAAYGYRPLSSWAATPVIHFSYEPGIVLKSYIAFLKPMIKVRVKLKRFIAKLYFFLGRI